MMLNDKTIQTILPAITPISGLFIIRGRKMCVMIKILEMSIHQLGGR